jgi:hypothetical protein
MAVRTIAAGGGNWNATATWIEGIVPILGDNVFAAVTSGQLTVNVAAACTSINFTNYTNTLTMNATLSVGGSVTLVAAMTITGTGILSITAAATITSNGKTWSGALTLFGGSHSFGDNWTVTGLLTTTTNTTLNNNSITCNGGIRVNGGTTVGSCIIKLGGGTWTAKSTTSAIRNPFQFVGDCTVSGNVAFNNNTMTWVSGAITTAGSRLYIQAARTTLNTSGMTWNQVRFSGVGITHTLTSDLNVNTLLLGNSTNQTTINGSTINVTNGITVLGISGGLTKGTTNIKITGGFITSSGMTLRSPLEIAGDVTIVSGNTLRYNTGTLTYTSGKVTTTGSTLLIELATTLINMDKIAWNIVNVTAGVTLTMNKFFSGSPKQKTTMQSVTSGTAYTITFQDTFEKTAKFVKVSDCSLTRKGQLLMLTPNSDKGGNSGIRYINQSPNGIAKNSPSVVDPITYPSFGLVADPCFN